MIQLKVVSSILPAFAPIHTSLLILLQTMLNCIDNSGAIIVECVANLRMKRHGKVGEECLQEHVESRD